MTILLLLFVFVVYSVSAAIEVDIQRIQTAATTKGKQKQNRRATQHNNNKHNEITQTAAICHGRDVSSYNVCTYACRQKEKKTVEETEIVGGIRRMAPPSPVDLNIACVYRYNMYSLFQWCSVGASPICTLRIYLYSPLLSAPFFFGYFTFFHHLHTTHTHITSCYNILLVSEEKNTHTHKRIHTVEHWNRQVYTILYYAVRTKENGSHAVITGCSHVGACVSTMVERRRLYNNNVRVASAICQSRSANLTESRRLLSSLLL